MSEQGRKVSDIGEIRLIERITERLGDPPRGDIWAGDDAAVISEPGAPALYTTDALVEEVDFDLSYCSGEDVGWKAIAINASDIAAMGGAPRHAIASLLLPTETPVALVDELVTGMSAAAARWGVGLVGGDISRARELSITVAMLGIASHDRVVSRSGAATGDALCVTGSLGASAGGLVALRHGLGDARRAGAERSRAAVARLVRRHLRPTARVEAGERLCGLGVAAMIDVSDGLAVDLEHLLDASDAGCVVDRDAIPVDQDLHVLSEVLPEDEVDPLKLALTGGEDFELLLALDPGAVEEARSALDEIGVKLAPIGNVIQGERRIGDRPLEEWRDAGWDHLLGR